MGMEAREDSKRTKEVNEERRGEDIVRLSPAILAVEEPGFHLIKFSSVTALRV
jgi:hypothetical protein